MLWCKTRIIDTKTVKYSVYCINDLKYQMYFNVEEKKTLLHISLTHKYAIISNCHEYTFQY